MNSFFGRRTMIWACLMALGMALAPATSGATAKPDPKVKKAGFRLFARASGSLRVNQVTCGLISDGQICVDSTGSSTIPGSVWPKGTNNQYTFNSGISIAGVIGPEVAGWAGDTTGSFFFDGAGKQNGEQVQAIYNASDPTDANAWPDFAKVPSGTDPGAAVFDPLLQGTNSASQGDVWFLSWDGNPTALAGRPHPLGVAVETRGLAWNYPSGNQDIIYFIYTLYNITSTDPASYALVRPALQSILLTKAQEFKTRNEAAFGISIPTTGYTLKDVFMAFAADQDVTAAAGANYATFNNAFNMAITYHEKFAPAPGNVFDPAIHGPPFLPGPGFVGTKYLRSPILPSGAEAGTVLAGMTTNRGSFPDPVSTAQLYRYISGNLNPAVDPQCNTGNPAITHLCFVNPQPSDARTFQSSGPLQLAPGGQATIVVAYIFAAPLATGKCPTIPCPITMAPNPLQLANAGPGSDNVNAVDSAMGYRGISATAGNPVTQEDFKNLVPRSLLQKAIVAQTVFNLKFLLPFAPQAPEFYLVPGDNQVSILWKPTVSETTGDPFFQVATQPTVTDTSGNVLPNPLYDPNYRQFDVEGYRIYRGRTDSPNTLELLAQFDYAGTSILDFRGFVNPRSTCAPELPTVVPDSACTFTIPAPGSPFTVADTIPLVGDIIQIKTGGRVALANGTALVVQSDTAVGGGGTHLPPLADTGVPFAFTDDGSGLLSAPRDNVRYFYSVTAFDINSLTSAPGTLESQRVTKAVTPVKAASNVASASLHSSLQGDDAVDLDPSIAWSIDANTGRFIGSPPPTDGVQGVFAPLVPVLLPTLSLTATIDSVNARSASDATCAGAASTLATGPGTGTCTIYYATFNKDGVETKFTVPLPFPVLSGFGTNLTESFTVGALPVLPDPTTAARFGIPAGTGAANAAMSVTAQQTADWSSFEGQGARRGRFGNNGANPVCVGTETNCAAAVSPGGSRWFEGADETVDHPAVSIRVGHLPGVDSVWAPIHHVDQDPVTPDGQPPANSGVMQFFGYGFSNLSREADVQLTWGTAGAIASVRDVTHHVPVAFSPDANATYGFVTDADGDGVISWEDFSYIPAVAQFWIDQAVGIGGPTSIAQARPLVAAPTVTGVSTSFAGNNAGFAPYTATGQGFGLYINGERYIFQLTGGAFPAAGTVWTLRTYTGRVAASTNPASAAPSGYNFRASTRSPVVPGLHVGFSVTQPTQILASTSNDLRQVHTVPDPYYVTSSFETTTTDKIIKFVNLPSQCIIRIYSSSGVLVSILEHNSTTLGGDETWNVRNRNNQVVASGVYFYHIEAGGARRIGRFTVVNFAQ